MQLYIEFDSFFCRFEFCFCTCFCLMHSTNICGNANKIFKINAYVSVCVRAYIHMYASTELHVCMHVHRNMSICIYVRFINST